MTMHFICYRRCYQVEMAMEDFMVVMDHDGSDTQIETALPDALFNVEYGGHFGPTLNFDVANEDDTAELHDKTIKAIERWVLENRT